MSRSRAETRLPSPATLELAYQPNLGMATDVSRCVMTFCERFVRDVGVLARLRVAVQELLENTALYASDNATQVRVTVRERSGDSVVTVETTNRAEAGDISRLESSLDEIARSDDLQAHYQYLMKRSVGGEHLPGLGLGRIAAEPGMSLHYEREGDIVTVSAKHAPRPVEPRPDLDLPEVAAANFRAVASAAAGVLTLTMSGVADEPSREVVASLISRLHEEALRTRANRVVIDVRKLEFMSSSCIKSLVSWVSTLQELDEATRYPVFFLYDPTAHWQTRSLEPLRRLASEVVSLGT